MFVISNNLYWCFDKYIKSAMYAAPEQFKLFWIHVNVYNTFALNLDSFYNVFIYMPNVGLKSFMLDYILYLYIGFYNNWVAYIYYLSIKYIY